LEKWPWTSSTKVTKNLSWESNPIH